MENKDKRFDEGNREGQPGNFNPRDVDFEHPAKIDKAEEKVDIKESELGREASQKPANEQMEPMSQIDEGTKNLQQDSEPSDKGEDETKK